MAVVNRNVLTALNIENTMAWLGLAWLGLAWLGACARSLFFYKIKYNLIS